MKRRISRRQLLLAAAGTGLGGPVWATTSRGGRRFALGSRTFALADTPPYILWIHCDGGWDPTMVFESKMGVTSCAQEPGISQASVGNLSYVRHPDRPAVDTFLSAHGSRCVFVNGLYCRGLSHEEGLRGILTRGTGQRDDLGTDWMSLYARLAGPDKVAPHLVLGGPYLPGSNSKYAVRIDADAVARLTGTRDLEFEDDVEELILARVDKSYRDIQEARDADATFEKMRDHVASTAASRSVDLRNAVRDAVTATTYQDGAHDFLSYARLALRMFSQDRSQCATLSYGAARQWDSHRNHWETQGGLFQSLFADLSTLQQDLSTLGLEDRVLVIVASELGRAPVLNEADGKGHGSYTSAFLCGALVGGGKVVGRTDEVLRGVPINPVFGFEDGPGLERLEMSHVISAVLAKCGLDYETHVGVRPLSPIVNKEEEA